ncbi:CU044_5270 family protein [Kribbella sp. NBC_00889]|uniref:CU044_5270 family protein n=1 Tax=Kribbella sp. NBC_00889 TaxID=2975974 RepID=UPI00386F3500|nr:CU044_5270 family protein [Kribbella sp. NBC_00889]
MNEIDLLKRVRDDVPPPDPIALARARQRLLTPSPVRRSVGRRRVLVAGAVAATLAVGFLVNDVVIKDGATKPGAVADANTFLANAAELTSANPDAPIPPGQYRQVTQRSQGTWRFGPQNSYVGTRLDVSDWWISADQKAPYTAISVLNATKEFSPAAAKQLWSKIDPLNMKPETIKSPYACGVLPRGGGILLQKKGSKNICTGSWLMPSPEFLARLPRDTDELLAALRKGDDLPRGFPARTPQRADEEAFNRVATVLASGIAPADLRAALYQAARKIPGIQLQADAVNLDGKAGRAIGRVQFLGVRQELIIEPRTGQFLGLREVATITAPRNVNGDPQPLVRGDVVTWTSVSTRITPTHPTIR